MCMDVLPSCLSVCVLHACLVPEEARRGRHIPWNWAYEQL